MKFRQRVIVFLVAFWAIIFNSTASVQAQAVSAMCCVGGACVSAGAGVACEGSTRCTSNAQCAPTQPDPPPTQPDPPPTQPDPPPTQPDPPPAQQDPPPAQQDPPGSGGRLCCKGVACVRSTTPNASDCERSASGYSPKFCSSNVDCGGVNTVGSGTAAGGANNGVENTVTTSSTGGGNKKICDSAGEAKGMCEACMGTGDEVEGVWTAIGCISTQPAEAAKQIFNLALGVGGVFILVQILMGAFGLITSSGNPSAVEKAKKQITSSVIALLFLVFSIALLQLIGMEILMLPGMASTS